MISALDKIITGEIRVKRVTVPEGMSVYRTMRILADNEIGNYQRLINKAKDPAFAKEVTGLDINTLEGFLYPDTYLFGLNMTEENIIKHMVQNFFSKISMSDIKSEDKEQFYKDIILASIVEREAIFNDEKPIIAGVFLNRLRINMRLQACPTALYHLESEFTRRRNVTLADTRNRTPYNTYVIYGLPPHPICSPAVSSILAVQKPVQSDYLFFIADGTGRHSFNRTYAEHLQRQRQMRNQDRASG